MDTLLFKSPPRITLSEMCGELPSTDAMFEASDSTEYQQLLATVKARSWKLMDLMNTFLGEAWPKPSSDWSSIEAEHLMIIMFGNNPRLVLTFRQVLTLHSSSFYHLCVAHWAFHAINKTNLDARYRSLERALARDKVQAWR